MRTIVEDCFKWLHQRKAFGKPLAVQPVLRNKMANMISSIEVLQAYSGCGQSNLN